MDRSMGLSQSNGRWNIEHDWGERTTCPFVCFAVDKFKARLQNARLALYFEDWFHSIVNWSTPKISLVVIILYFIVFSLFAVPYWWISRERLCDMDPDMDQAKASVQTHEGSVGNHSKRQTTHQKYERPLEFSEAFLFSVETMATIGYGAPDGDIFFNGCYSMEALIFAETCCGLLMNGILLGILLNRVARGSPRANTILFSDRAIMRKIRGRYHFMCQVCEIRKHALVEAHVRCYLIRKDVDHLGTALPSPFECFTMRLSQPNDELGAARRQRHTPTACPSGTRTAGYSAI